MSRPLNIYTAEPAVRDGSGLLRSMFSGLWHSPYLSYRLVIKDVKAEYSKSAFGLVWDLVDPLVLGAIFYFLMSARIISVGEIGIPYPVFVIFGLLLYQTFMDSILLPLDVMRRSRGLVRHLSIPPEALLLSCCYHVLFNSSFRIVAMLAFALSLDAFSPLGFLKFLVAFPSLILTGMAIGVLLAPFNTIYGDVGRVVRIILHPLRYASPILYAIPNTPPFSYVYDLNPLATILDNLRSLATEGVFLDPEGFVIRVGGFAGILLLGWFLFHVSLPVLAERT